MPQILVVDDDHLIRQALKQRLTHSGYDVQTAGSGGEAMELFRASKPQVIVLDASMPDVSGFDVCQCVRDADQTRQTKVIFLTGAGTPGDEYVARCAQASNADGFLRKPYDFHELAALIDRALTAENEAGK